MEQEKALELVKQGSTLLFLDVPQYTLIGIDTQVFSAGPEFKGIKMIPPGVHFIFYSSSTKDGKEFSPIIGFFIETSPSEVVVRKWNLEEERLVKVPDEEEERYAQAVKQFEFDRHLGPYSLSDYGDWKRLSNYITKDVIERIEPIGGEITVACESSLVGNIPKTTMEIALAEQLKNSKFNREAETSDKKGCYYTPVPRVIKQRGISVAELTSVNLDKTYILESILMKEFEGDEDRLLGELQFAFIAFLMGQSLDGFLQWKSLVSLLFGCTQAPFHTRSQLFIKFIKCVYYQLKYGFQRGHAKDSTIEKESSLLLDDSWLTSDSFLHHLCKEFFLLVDEASVVDGDLLTWTRKLRELLENTLGWEFHRKSAVDGLYFEEDDEYAPVVEMLDESS
ncbi:protein AAR2 homolog [Chenopodium quinoa]|uniref:protein AAR2 homolog n=1 Tax=Chenopodium quinoa TaxID=63459 RepID=UPI000B76E1F3|nr:protein AAR2 homolog [Chenopodium quinoa]